MIRFEDHSDYCGWLHFIGMLDIGHRDCRYSDSCVATEAHNRRSMVESNTFQTSQGD